MDSFATRRAKVAAWLKAKGVAAALVEDTEGRRDPSLRYLSGHPNDAILVVADDGRSILVPWDVNMAKEYSKVDEVVPYAEFGRTPAKALAGILERLGAKKGSTVELPRQTPYLSYVKYVEELEHYDPLCREDGVGTFIQELRAVKDLAELASYRKGAKITDDLMDDIERGVKSGEIRTETDAALFIERGLRARGAERVGFDILAAGPKRSFGIHCFPNFTGGPFGTEGMSILDFGVVVDGYTTDVTMTFVRGAVAGKRAKMIELVKKAYEETVAMCDPGRRTYDICKKADDIFKAEGFTMPHSLGHGVGLEAHELPEMRLREENVTVLKPGHIVTIEPGLYDLELGGVRWENDVLVTETGYEVLTHSRIVTL